jgi:hemerythrin-like domain-containing protein
MKATDVLMAEHRVIEQVLNVLEVIARRAEQREGFDTAAAEKAIDFFRTFADLCHHGKEEDLLFPRLEAHGLPRDGGPTGVMMHEHELGRDLLRQMAAAVEHKSPAGFAEPARDYVRLLRDHIWKEDQRLFQMAGQVLTAADDDELMREFETVEHDHLGAGVHEQYLRVANRLAEQFGVPMAVTPKTCGGCGCHATGPAVP